MPQGGRLEAGLNALDAALGETGGTRLEDGLLALDAALDGQEGGNVPRGTFLPSDAPSLFGAEEHGRMPQAPRAGKSAADLQARPGTERERNLRARGREVQRLATTPAEPSLGEKLSSAGTDAWSGLVGALLSVPEFAGRVAQGGGALPLAEDNPVKGWLQQSGDFLVALSQEAKRDLPAADPRVQDSFVFGSLPRGAGSFAGTVLSAYAGGGAGALGVGTAATATGLMEQTEAELATKVAAGEVTKEEAEQRSMIAFLAGIGLGGLDMIPVLGILNRANRATGGGVRRALTNIAKGVAGEGAQELVQTGGEQGALEWLGDGERTVLERLSVTGEAGGVGGILGGVLAMALGAKGLRRAGRAAPAATTETAEPVVQPEAAQAVVEPTVAAEPELEPAVGLEESKAIQAKEMEAEGDRVIREALGIQEGVELPEYLKAKPPTSPVERGLAALDEAIANEPVSAAVGQAVAQPEMLDPAEIELAAEAVEKVEMGDSGALPSSARTTAPADPHGVFQPIAPRLKGAATTAAATPLPGQPISSPQVQDAFAGVVEAAGRIVPFRIGRIAQRNARGVFKVGPEIIRIREAGNLPTAAHETFHALEKALYGWKENPWQAPRVGPAIQKELAALGRELYGDTRPTGGYRREGWAEFGRLWLTENATARAKAPKLTEWLEARFLPENPDVADALRKAAGAMTQWQTQGPRARAQASIEDPTGPRARLRSVGETLRQAFGKQAWVEMGEPIRQFSEMAQERTGEALPSSRDPWALYEGLRLTHDARAERMISEAMIDLAGNRVGPSLRQALAPVRGKREDFTFYLWGRQAQLYWNDPNRIGGRNPGLSREDADALVAELRSPAFEIAEGQIREWHDGVLDYAAQASPAFAQVVERVRESHPGYLMPLQRVFDDIDGIWQRAARRSAGQATSRSPVQALRGSGRRIKEPFQAMISNARAIVLKAHQRAVLDAAIGLSHVEGMGGLIEKVPHDQVPVASRTIGDLIEEINRKLGPEAGVGIQGVEGLDISQLLGETLTFFAPAKTPSGKDPILPYWNGKSVDWYYVDGGLYKALTGMDVYRLPAILHWTLGATARTMRLGTTGMNPAFSLITNTIRDVQSLWMNSQASGNSGQLFASWLNQLGHAAMDQATLGRVQSKEMRAWLDMGGQMAQSLGQDIGHTRRAARQLFETPRVRVIDPRNWLDALRDVFQFPESAARATEIGRVAKEIGWEPGTPLSLDQSLDLLRAGKKVTTDFSAAGEYARAWNQIVPFFNAKIQGPRASINAARHHPARFLFRGMSLAAMTLGLWWAYKDEDWYEELPAKERFGFWHFKVGDEIIRIPRNFEVGAFFSALPEALADAWYRADPERATQWFSNMFSVKQTIMENLPVPARESAEQLANLDFYSGVPIVPRGEADMPAEEQYGEYTSRAAIVLGDLFGASPRRIDHAIRGVFGGVGTDLIETLGLGQAKVAREDEPADMPVLGRLFLRGGARPQRVESVDKLWDRLEEYTLRQRSKRVEETPDERQMRLQLDDAAKAVSALSWVRSHTPGAVERRRISVEILKIARDALEAEDAGRVERGRFQGQRKRSEAREATLQRIQ